MENVEDDMGEEYTYILDFDKMVFSAKGDDLDEVVIKLEKEELLKYARKWSEGPLDENYDPEEEMVEIKGFFERDRILAEQVSKMFND